MVSATTPAGRSPAVELDADQEIVAQCRNGDWEAFAKLVQKYQSRVLTLAAHGMHPAEIFSAVSREVAQLFGTDAAYVARFDPDGSAIVVGDFEGYVHWLDAATGELLARVSTDGNRVTGEVARPRPSTAGPSTSPVLSCSTFRALSPRWSRPSVSGCGPIA